MKKVLLLLVALLAVTGCAKKASERLSDDAQQLKRDAQTAAHNTATTGQDAAAAAKEAAKK